MNAFQSGKSVPHGGQWQALARIIGVSVVTFTACTDFLSGMRWSCGQPNRLVAGYFTQKTCKRRGKSRVFGVENPFR